MNYFDSLASDLSCLRELSQRYILCRSKRYLSHPNEDIMLRERKSPKSFRTQFQVKKEDIYRKKTIKLSGMKIMNHKAYII